MIIAAAITALCGVSMLIGLRLSPGRNQQLPRRRRGAVQPQRRALERRSGERRQGERRVQQVGVQNDRRFADRRVLERRLNPGINEWIRPDMAAPTDDAR
jgi:hypothetical protein